MAEKTIATVIPVNVTIADDQDNTPITLIGRLESGKYVVTTKEPPYLCLTADTQEELLTKLAKAFVFCNKSVHSYLNEKHTKLYEAINTLQDSTALNNVRYSNLQDEDGMHTCVSWAALDETLRLLDKILESVPVKENKS